jgi:hypothetical protein
MVKEVHRKWTFIAQKTLAMIFFTDGIALNLLLEESRYPQNMDAVLA